MRGTVRLPRRRPVWGEALATILLLADVAGHPHPTASDVFGAAPIIGCMSRSERALLRYELGAYVVADQTWPWLWTWLGGRPNQGPAPMRTRAVERRWVRVAEGRNEEVAG